MSKSSATTNPFAATENPTSDAACEYGPEIVKFPFGWNRSWGSGYLGGPTELSVQGLPDLVRYVETRRVSIGRLKRDIVSRFLTIGPTEPFHLWNTVVENIYCGLLEWRIEYSEPMPSSRFGSEREATAFITNFLIWARRKIDGGDPPDSATTDLLPVASIQEEEEAAILARMNPELWAALEAISKLGAVSEPTGVRRKQITTRLGRPENEFVAVGKLTAALKSSGLTDSSSQRIWITVEGARLLSNKPKSKRHHRV